MSELFRWTGSIAALSAETVAELADRSTSWTRRYARVPRDILDRVRERRRRSAARARCRARWRGARHRSRCRARRARSGARRARRAGCAARWSAPPRTSRRCIAPLRPRAVEIEAEPGIVVGRRPDPLDSRRRVCAGRTRGVSEQCAHGGDPGTRRRRDRASSSARRPGAARSAVRVVLAAAALAGVHEVFAVGGAGAIAAMAYGTQSIASVRRIVGPGNAYVAEAKLQLSGVAAIDSPAGPSELLVIADDCARANSVAREMLAQAEHDPRAAVVVVALSQNAACAVEGEIALAARERAASRHHRRIAGDAWRAPLERLARVRDRVRQRIRARASPARAARSRRSRSRWFATPAPSSSVTPPPSHSATT